MHRRSGVHNKFPFLKFKSWCRQAPIFRRWEECCFLFSFNFRVFGTRFHAASRAPCSCHSVSSWDRSSNFGALGLRWWASHLGKSFRAKDFGHLGLVSARLSSSVKLMTTSAAPHLERRNPIVVYLTSKRSQQVSPFCHVAHASST